MGRKKIQIKPITDEKVRKVTFNRRRNGILKKAYELSILCDTQVVVLMFDHKEMCHVYSSEEGANTHAKLMEKYITKDFCTVDPIRNYDTSPDLHLEDPSQAVWRVSREKVAVVNTYNVIPATGTPHLGSSKQTADDEEDDEADGSEQLAVKSSRTYHTKNGEAKFGANRLNTPAMTDKAPSPMNRSTSPEVRQGQSSPKRSPRHPQEIHASSLYPPQQGLGISGSGYTPLLRPGEQFTPILYPPQPPQARPYMWSSPEFVGADAYGGMAGPPLGRQHFIPNSGIEYAAQQLHSNLQYQPYEPQPAQYISNPLPPQPLLRQSPRKVQAHFNHYTYPPQQNQKTTIQSHAIAKVSREVRQEEPLYQSQFPRVLENEHDSPNGDYDSDQDPVVTLAESDNYIPVMQNNISLTSHPRLFSETGTNKLNQAERKSSKPDCSTTTNDVYLRENAELQAPRLEKRITRSQSRSPQMKTRQLPTKTPAPQLAARSQLPLHLRGPSLLDEISFDPVSGAPMMEASALASWLGTTSGPLQGVSPGHSRETSHVRGESVSQWLNMPATIPE